MWCVPYQMTNPWFVLDFVVIFGSLVSLLMGTKGGNLSSLRALRAMKSLKTVIGAPGRGLHSSTILLNLSPFCH